MHYKHVFNICSVCALLQQNLSKECGHKVHFLGTLRLRLIPSLKDSPFVKENCNSSKTTILRFVVPVHFLGHPPWSSMIINSNSALWRKRVFSGLLGLLCIFLVPIILTTIFVPSGLQHTFILYSRR